jgi:DNA-nicking Smr family endonuclease
MSAVGPPRRGASEEERALFKSAMKDTRPLRARTPFVKHEQKPVKSIVASWRIPHAPVHPQTPAPAIGGHHDARLRRGRGEPEGRLDLHGLTHDRAYRALLKFLMSAQADGKRLTLVITGKGGVLRRYLPLWLGQEELKPLVSGIAEAHATHGGSGAFYVALKRRAMP